MLRPSCCLHTMHMAGPQLNPWSNVGLVFSALQAVDKCLEMVDRMQRTGRSSHPVTNALLSSIQDDTVELWRGPIVSEPLVRWLRPRSGVEDTSTSPGLPQRQIFCCQILSRVYVVSDTLRG